MIREELTKIVVAVVVEGKSVKAIRDDLSAMLGLDDLAPSDLEEAPCDA